MPFAPVDEVHTLLFYEDSGPPIIQDRPYTTLVIVHGHSWNSHIFKRLIPLASASHVRLILLNRRGYSASTPLGEDELITDDPNPEHIDVPDLAYSAFLQRRGVELARFLAWFIEKERIPPPSNGKNGVGGGLSLLGWSHGNVTTLSFLSFANTFDPGLMRHLEPYIRKIVIYEPTLRSLGYMTPKDTYNPLNDPKVPPAETENIYFAWLSSYYIHSSPPLDLRPSNPIDGLEQITADPLKLDTMSRMSPADIHAGLETSNQAAMDGEAFSILPQARPTHQEVRLRAIFGNPNEAFVPIALSKVGISYVWCTQSVWDTLLAARLFKAEIDSPPSYYYPARRVKFFALEGNHYAHWDDPLKALSTFVTAIE